MARALEERKIALAPEGYVGRHTAIAEIEKTRPSDERMQRVTTISNTQLKVIGTLQYRQISTANPWQIDGCDNQLQSCIEGRALSSLNCHEIAKSHHKSPHKIPAYTLLMNGNHPAK